MSLCLNPKVVFGTQNTVHYYNWLPLFLHHSHLHPLLVLLSLSEAPFLPSVVTIRLLCVCIQVHSPFNCFPTMLSCKHSFFFSGVEGGGFLNQLWHKWKYLYHSTFHHCCLFGVQNEVTLSDPPCKYSHRSSGLLAFTCLRGSEVGFLSSPLVLFQYLV